MSIFRPSIFFPVAVFTGAYIIRTFIANQETKPIRAEFFAYHALKFIGIESVAPMLLDGNQYGLGLGLGFGCPPCLLIPISENEKKKLGAGILLLSTQATLNLSFFITSSI